MKNRKRLWMALFVFLIGESVILFTDQLLLKNNFCIDRFILFTWIPFICSLHIYFDIHKLWNFIYEKRYIIGICLFIFTVINGYHGSSIAVYEDVIQPNIKDQSDMPFLGNYRSIRSDEFLVDTPSVLSQAITNKEFSKYNHAMRAQESLVTLFPATPTRTLAILLKPHLIGYLLLPLEQAFSFAWYLPYFALFFGLFEVFMMITKEKRGFSLFGTLLLMLSPGILWWGTPQILIYGILATVFFQRFLKSDSRNKRLLYSILLGWMGACYIGTLYAAWAVPYGYLFLMLFIWLWIENFKNKSWKHLYFIYLIPIFAVMGILLVPVLIENLPIIELTGNTVYPGARVSTGGSGWQWFFHYMPSVWYPFKGISNASEFSQVLSLYPLPIFMGVYQTYKNYKSRKNDLLLNLLIIVTIGLSIWNFIDIGVLAKVTMMSMSVPTRSQLIASISCLFLLIILIANYSQQYKFNWKKSVLSFTVSCLILYIGLKACNVYIAEYMTAKVIIFSFVLFFILFYLFILNSKKTNYIFISVMCCILAVQGFMVMPVSRGLGAIRNKPLFKQVRALAEENEDAVFMTANAPIHMQSAVLANGAKTLNSTNYYPNFDFWYKIDPTKKYENLYNRYAHVIINLVNEETSMELLAADSVLVNLNFSDVRALNVDYIVTTSDSFEDFNNDDIQFQLIYSEDGSMIYQVNG